VSCAALMIHTQYCVTRQLHTHHTPTHHTHTTHPHTTHPHTPHTHPHTTHTPTHHTHTHTPHTYIPTHTRVYAKVSVYSLTIRQPRCTNLLDSKTAILSLTLRFYCQLLSNSHHVHRPTSGTPPPFQNLTARRQYVRYASLHLRPPYVIA
jgi:hypothetical protein